MVNRDGHCISLWQDMHDYISKNLPADADIVVIGGGITGLSTALRLQREGKKCVVLEAQNIGFGTTGGTTSHLNTLLDTPYYQIRKNFNAEAAAQVYEVTHKALALIEKNVLGYEIDCYFERKPAYVFAQDEKQKQELERIVEASIEAGLHMEESTKIPVPLAFTKAAKASDQAQMHSARYLYGIAKAFDRMGGCVVQNCRATEVTHSDHQTIVHTTKGKIKAAHVIYATHVPPGINILHTRCAPYRSYAMAVTLNDGNYPDALVYDLDEPYHYYRTQEVDGMKYLIFGGEDHKTGHEDNTEHCFAMLESYLRKHYDINEVCYKWSSQYYESKDGLPYIGHLPGNPENVWVATGFGGNGMILGTVASCVLADLICKGDSPYRALFSPSRFKPVAGFARAAKESADVLNALVGKKISVEKIEGMSELSHNEGRVGKYEGNRIAVYKNESGKLFALRPDCPHMGCALAWNQSEKSWDCPCHGSRFSHTGGLLTAPATQDLVQIELAGEESIKEKI